jgi:hypothetical protein
MEKSNEQNMLRWAMLGLSAIMVYKLWQSARKFFWMAFGIGWAAHWGVGPFF